MSAKKQNGKKKPAPVAKQPVIEKSISKPVPSFFDKRGKTVFYALIGLLALVSFVVFKDFLLFQKLFLFKDIGSDSLNGYYPNIMATSNYLRQYGAISWSFHIGMGQNGAPLAFYDCLNAILYLFPPSKIAWLLGYIEVVKVIAGGAVFYFYLRQLGNGAFSAYAGALMFAFCGYMIVGGEWYGFSFEALETAIALLGFELLFQKNMPWLFPLPFLLIGISNPFNLYLITVFLLIYAVFRYLQDQRKGVKGLAVLFLKMAGLGAIAVAISTPLLFAYLQAMLESARVSGGNSYFASLSSTPILSLASLDQLGTCIGRFFSSEMLGTADQFKGAGNYLEAPMFYCGIACLILVPLLFGYLSSRERKLYGALLAIWLLPILFPYFRRAFWLFSGDYYRTYSLYLSLVFIVCSVACLNRVALHKKINAPLLAIVALGLIVIQLFPYFGDKHAIDPNIALATKIYVLVYAALLYWLTQQKSDLPKFFFLAVMITELAWFSSISVNRNACIKSSEWKGKTGYNDYSADAIAFLKKTDKSFYRIDKPIGSSPAENQSLNDAMVQDYYGTSCYNSFNQKYYLQYLLAYHIISAGKEEQSRWSVGLTGRPILQSLNSVKYIVSKGLLSKMQRPGYDSLATFGDFTIYKNSFVLPLGFCYGSYIKYSDFEKASMTQRDFISLGAAVVNDSDASVLRNLKPFDLKDTVNPERFTLDMYRNYWFNLKQDTMDITKFSPTAIAGNVALTQAKILYLSIPYDIGWHLMVDGQPCHILLIANGMIGVSLGVGNHRVEINYAPPYRNTARLLALAGLLLYGGLIFVSHKKRRIPSTDIP